MFTPGPWTVYNGHDGDFADSPYVCAEPLVQSGKPSAIARLMHGNPNTEANARLIAQAPAMIEALEKIADGYADNDHARHCIEWRRLARAAIAAARCQPETVVPGQPARRQRYREVTEEHQRRTAPQ